MHSADSTRLRSASELGDIPQQTPQQQIVMLVTLRFSIAGRRELDERGPIGHQSGKRRLHVNVIEGGGNDGDHSQQSHG